MSSFGHPQGFNLKIATCFTKVSILVLNCTGRRKNLWSLVHKQPRIKHEMCDSSPPVFSPLSHVPSFCESPGVGWLYFNNWCIFFFSMTHFN